MRTGTRILLALALAGGMVACGGDDSDVETFDAEEAATPAVETPAASAVDAPVLTAQFEAEGEEAGTGQVTGTVRIYREDTGTPAATAGEPAAGEEMTGEETTGEETTGVEESETATPEMGAETAATENGFRLEVTLNGLSQGEHAWHIHDGPCGEQAPVAVAISPTSDAEGIGESLSAAEGGTVESSVEVPANQLTLDQLRSGHYSLHVHQQGGVDHGPTVACANLSGEEDSPTM